MDLLDIKADTRHTETPNGAEPDRNDKGVVFSSHQRQGNPEQRSESELSDQRVSDTPIRQKKNWILGRSK